MKIIKQGKSKAEIKKIKNIVKRFKCLTCECVFEADNNEYKSSQVYTYVPYYCKCPNCGDDAFELECD